MARQPTLKQKAFVQAYLETGNATKSALKTYDTEDYNVAHSIGSENLQKPTIQEMIRSHADDAQAMIYKLSQGARNEAVRLQASKDIMDRAGFKPIEKSITLDATPLVVKIIDDKSDDKGDGDSTGVLPSA